MTDDNLILSPTVYKSRAKTYNKHLRYGLKYLWFFNFKFCMKNLMTCIYSVVHEKNENFEVKRSYKRLWITNDLQSLSLKASHIHLHMELSFATILWYMYYFVLDMIALKTSTELTYAKQVLITSINVQLFCDTSSKDITKLQN